MSPNISLLQTTLALRKAKSGLKPFALAKFFLRACLHRRSTREWLALLAQPDLAPLHAAHPRLAIKQQRRFVSTAWKRSARVAALKSHYDIARRFFPPAALWKIYAEGLALLHISNTTTNRRLTLGLSYTSQFEREGELTLSLTDAESGLPLSRITFCLCDGVPADGNPDARARRVFIGGLQACSDPRVRPIIHDLAKEMHGLRAKALVLWCLRELAAHWGATEILAVDDAHHVSIYRNRPAKISTSYDEFWEESEGAHDEATGFWRIPLQLRERGREELKPSRRRQHERRYALLADLRESLLEAARTCETAEFFHASPPKEKNASPPDAPSGPGECVRESTVSLAGLG